MDNVTPANRSRIPKVNMSSSRIRRSISLSTLPQPDSWKTPAVGGKTVPGRAMASRTLKRPANSLRENVIERKKQAMAPLPNQTSKVTKVPSWDIKGKLKQAEENIARLKENVSQLTSANTDQSHKIEEMRKQIISLEAELKEKTSDLDSTKRHILDKQEMVERLTIQHAECDRLYRESVLTLESTTEKLALKEETLSLVSKKMAEIGAAFHEKEAAFSSQQRILMDREASLKSYQEECVKLMERFRRQEAHCKDLHNKIMEMKGNIRVFCRVRPLLSGEMAEQKLVEHLSFTDENSMEVIKGPKKTKSSFSFDRVFSPCSKQTDIFEELSELIQSVIDGYNVCVFAYGQTGSGKTYTMEGGFGQDERGMIPRSIDRIFAVLDEMISTGWKYQIEASFLEIYNEQIRDLLDIGNAEKSCEIRNPTVAGGDMVITNLKVEVVTSASQVYNLLNIAKTNRAVAATVHNDHSSRSHFVFKLRLVGENATAVKSSDAVLSLVDLAGSERLMEITENVRVAETKNINRSLSNLGNVILALSQKNEHVPYRNSKLTHLLQTSLGGNSKTLMLVNLSPREDCVDETLNSLRFAVRVNECHVGRARRQAK